MEKRMNAINCMLNCKKNSQTFEFLNQVIKEQRNSVLKVERTARFFEFYSNLYILSNNLNKNQIVGELATEIKEEILKQEDKMLILKKDEMEVETLVSQPAKIFNSSVKINDGVMLLEDNNILILKEKDLPKFTSFLPK